MKLYGLIGYPLGHSFSKKYFTDKFEKEEIEAKYELFELNKITEFPSLIEGHTLSGLNVTIPYKEQVIPFLDSMDETAEKIGAVNAIQFIRKNGQLSLKGFNTDVVGFSESIKPLLKSNHKKALILGTGGASKAVAFALEQLGIELKFVSRNPKENQFSYDDLDEKVFLEFNVIINTTPLGTFPNIEEAPDIPYHCLTENHLMYDLVYNPAETSFLKKGKEQGAVIKNGEEMLIMQAEATWTLWNRR